MGGLFEVYSHRARAFEGRQLHFWGKLEVGGSAAVPEVVRPDAGDFSASGKVGKIDGFTGNFARFLPFLKFAFPVVFHVPREGKQRLFSRERVDARVFCVAARWFEAFARRIYAFDERGEWLEVPPELVFVYVDVPVPRLAASGGSGEERNVERVVENGAVFVGAVEPPRLLF